MDNITIAISGLPGSGNSTTGKNLAEKLSLRYFSAGKLVKDINLGIYKDQPYYSEFKKLCESHNLIVPDLHSSNDSEAAFKSWNTDFGRSVKFNNVVDNLQALLGERGGIVIDGKLALFMVKSAHFKIWVKADLETRIRRTAERDKISLGEAKNFLTTRQETERSGLKAVYGLDLFEQEKIANLVIDTSKLTPEQILEKILLSLNNKV